MRTARARGEGAGNLPHELTSFVGRRQETLELRQALTRSRLVTLTGTGGVGKTRLAIHVAESVRRSFSDGVFVVELAAVKDGLVPHAIAASLDLRGQSSRSLEAALADYLSGKELLLVVDNCEHELAASGSIISNLLKATSHVRVLATSREPLSIAGEAVWPVAPLSVPNLGGRAERGAGQPVDGFEAVTLFVERAASAVPGFQLTPENREAVSRLCARVDGLPLAIELAAVRLRALTVQEVLERLEHRFGLLIDGNRAALPRHRTLAAAIAWSHDLCSNLERETWARCSTFAGGFDLDAAESVLADETLSADDVLAGVTGLVEKSVLTKSEVAGRARYHMLETIRYFGREQLEGWGAAERFRRRHRDYFAGLAERADRECGDGRQLEWAQRLRLDRLNLWAALDFCQTHPGEAGVGLRMGADLWFYWIACGSMAHGQHLLTELLDLSVEHDEAVHDRDRARALWVAGWALVVRGDNVAGVGRLEEARALADELGDQAASSHATQLLGVARLFADDPLGAAPYLDQALAAHRRADAWTGSALSAFPQRALAAAMTGAADEAASLCEECRRLCAGTGERWAMSWVEYVLALTGWLAGDASQVLAHMASSLQHKRAIGDLLGIPFCVELRAWLASDQQDHSTAAGLYGFADGLWERVGTPLFGYRTLQEWSRERRKATERALGRRTFDDTHTAGRAWDFEHGMDIVLGCRPADRPPHDPPRELTKREWEVAQLVAEGLSNQEIADRLVISRRTAETHVDRILSKVGFHNRTQLASWVATASHRPADRQAV
jgi:predicted ATPase/DNA-binding CsgD family transcriptional regulator